MRYGVLYKTNDEYNILKFRLLRKNEMTEYETSHKLRCVWYRIWKNDYVRWMSSFRVTNIDEICDVRRYSTAEYNRTFGDCVFYMEKEYLKYTRREKIKKIEKYD